MFGGGGGFGQQNNTGGGLFGGGGGFGQQNNNTGGECAVSAIRHMPGLTLGFGQSNNAFGQPAQQPQQNQGGLFGGGNTNTNTGFGFGGNNAQQQNNAFGGASTAARPTFGATGTSTFGSTSELKLAICRELANQRHGRGNVRSEHPATTHQHVRRSRQQHWRHVRKSTGRQYRLRLWGDFWPVWC